MTMGRLRRKAKGVNVATTKRAKVNLEFLLVKAEVKGCQRPCVAAVGQKKIGMGEGRCHEYLIFDIW